MQLARLAKILIECSILTRMESSFSSNKEASDTVCIVSTVTHAWASTSVLEMVQGTLLAKRRYVDIQCDHW